MFEPYITTYLCVSIHLLYNIFQRGKILKIYFEILPIELREIKVSYLKRNVHTF